MALPNYVKFQRGTFTAYNRLRRKDDNTLYFVYESPNSLIGSLYLGDKLISDNVGGNEVTTLSDLTDVIINNANAGDFLVLNSEGQWTSISAAGVAEAILSAGGNFITIDEQQFQLNAVDGKLELKGYNNAATGLVPVKGDTGLGWINLPPDLSTEVGDLEAGLNAANSAITAMQSDLQAVDGKIAQAISDANHLKYEVVSDLSAITAENVIYLHSGDTTAVNNIYQEYLLVDGIPEQIGSTNIDLDQYVQTTTFTALDNRVSELEPVVGNLTATVAELRADFNLLINTIPDEYVLISTFNAVIGDLTAVNGVMNNLQQDDSIAETLEDIYERLTWQEISE